MHLAVVVALGGDQLVDDLCPLLLHGGRFGWGQLLVRRGGGAEGGRGVAGLLTHRLTLGWRLRETVWDDLMSTFG